MKQIGYKLAGYLIRGFLFLLYLALMIGPAAYMVYTVVTEGLPEAGEEEHCAPVGLTDGDC